MNLFFKPFALLFTGVAIYSVSCKKDKTSETLINQNNLTLKSDTFWNGSDLSGGFTCGNAYFANSYTDTTGWNGFAYSNQHDTVTVTKNTDYNYQYYLDVAEPAADIFIIGYINVYGADSVNITFTKPMNLVNLNVANDTYAALSMRNGDSFAKKFGAGDWFKVTVTGYNKTIKVGTATAYLADFRSSPYYILNKWLNVNLSSFGTVDELSFKLSSSDNSPYNGVSFMNTPAYFCLENIEGAMTND